VRKFLALLACASIFPLAGCSLVGGGGGAASEVTFTQPSRNRLYESFPGAYITSNRDGEYDIVLVNDTLRASAGESRKKPLQPVNQPPLQQAIHIHVFWRPVSGAMVKESSITNAIVHWYVFSGEASRNNDMLHYEGAAFVTLSAGDQTAKIEIGDGHIAPRQSKGDLKDPVGPSKITGTIRAVRNDARVRELLAGIQSKAAGSTKIWAQAEADEASVLDK
jgi:hypothetical protein